MSTPSMVNCSSEDLGVADVKAGGWAAEPDAGLAALGNQLFVAGAVADHGELAEAVLRRHRVLPADS